MQHGFQQQMGSPQHVSIVHVPLSQYSQMPQSASLAQPPYAPLVAETSLNISELFVSKRIETRIISLIRE